MRRNYYWQETLDAYKSGKVAMAMDYYAFLPAAVDPGQNPNFHDKSGFFIAPAGPKGHYNQHRRARNVDFVLLEK